MKTHLLMTTALAASVMLAQANAGEKELSKHQVPKAVLEAFEKAMSALNVEMDFFV